MTQHPTFEWIIIICIILNTTTLAITWYNSPASVNSTTEIINYIFAAIFTFEALFKILAIGKKYFADSWNIFDFIIVIGTFVGIIINTTTDV